MVILKKIKAATLVETLTASVIIIIVFMIASLSFNTIFINHQKRDHSAIDNRLKELTYKSRHNVIQLPYQERFANWDIYIEVQNEALLISAERNGYTITKKQKW
ncbi:hypothetical protein [Aquimarina brevivitae]|uniref:Prepilin-type N-terminal cleavage/methylation domain-containing protein n=1 Tax=Aquimarina brevivitae TaxID=323412 RepID=A0A4V2F772_9FLAO|nr:hypothetical protein [Aquimarina brevivitae]RZS98809.1 hypothetical protein EV197_0009 [Aquimarina brevivitae]